MKIGIFQNQRYKKYDGQNSVVFFYLKMQILILKLAFLWRNIISILYNKFILKYVEK